MHTGIPPPWEQTPPREQTHTHPQDQTPPPGSRHTPRDQTPLGADTPLEQTLPVNKRPVRILLECILVTPVSQSCYSQGGGGVMMLLPVMDSTHPLDSTSKQHSCPHPNLNSPPPPFAFLLAILFIFNRSSSSYRIYMGLSGFNLLGTFIFRMVIEDLLVYLDKDPHNSSARLYNDGCL